MGMVHDERSLETLPRAQCIELLRSGCVGRVVFTERALPAVLPVSYGVLDEDVVIRAELGSRLAEAARSGVLAFEVDDIDIATRTGWSVVVTGVPSVIRDPAGLERVAAVLDPWVHRDQDVAVRIPATVVTGRRIVASDMAPAPAYR